VPPPARPPDTAWTGTPRLKQAADIVQQACSEIRLEQGELDEVHLRAAAADALTLIEYWLDIIDGSGEVLSPECRKRPSQGRLRTQEPHNIGFA
jgi:hypothetical protein